MTLSDTATAQLWETFRAGGGAGLIRETVELVLQELIEAEAAEVIGAGRYERSDTRIAERNGHRGLKVALDHDLIFCCVDRPWPRAVLNALAYSDLIPVIDGGIAIDPLPDGTMRNATWRSHVIRPQRPCMSCNGQPDLGTMQAERLGLLDDPTYIANPDPRERPQSQDVAPLSVNVSASLLAQYVSFSAAPGGFGDPGPLRQVLSAHILQHRNDQSRPHCPIEPTEATGDNRPDLTDRHPRAEQQRQKAAFPSIRIRLLRWMDDVAQALTRWLDRSLLGGRRCDEASRNRRVAGVRRVGDSLRQTLTSRYHARPTMASIPTRSFDFKNKVQD